MKIYLAGPMTGYPEMNHPLFHAEAARLRAVGHEVVNPAEEAPDQSMAWIDAMMVDIPVLMACEAIALLPGWEGSNGARIEHCIAINHGMQVYMAADIVGCKREAA